MALLAGFLVWQARAQDSIPPEILITGVNQGKVLFIQNPYLRDQGEFCIESVLVNNRQMNLNINVSAIVLDFETIDLYTPVSIKIRHKPGCRPTIINPDAIFFHTIFNFKNIYLSDTTLVWNAVGDKKGGMYLVERFHEGLWEEEVQIESKGIFEGADYIHYLALDEGANKFRIKYTYPNGSYLYSREIDFHFYPDPVTFTPKRTRDKITFSRTCHYEIYDAGGKLVLEGQFNQADVSSLPRGDYVIYFDGKDPGVFGKE